MQLRLAVPGDLDTVESLYHGAVGSPGCTWNEFYPTREDAENDVKQANLYVLEQSGEICGACSVISENELDTAARWRVTDGCHCEIARLVIANQRRGQGLAKTLLTQLFSALHSKGFSSVRLLVAICNPAAVQTYRSLGFSFLNECEMYGNRYYAAELKL